MLSKKAIVLKTLLDELKNDQLHPGGYIPSRNQLMRRFHCSRTVIEKAVAELTAMGYLTGRQGKGTMICRVPDQVPQKIRKLNVISPYDAKSFRSPFTCLLLNSNELGMPVEMIPVERAEAECENLCQSDTLTVHINPGYEQLPVMNFLKKRNICQILINREFDGFDRIYTDTLAGFRQGLAHLTPRPGELAVIGRKPALKYPYQSVRINSLFQACLENSLTLRPENILLREFTDPAEEMQYAAEIFAGKHPKIVVMNGDLTIEVINFAASLGLKPGKDYQLLAFEYLSALAEKKGISLIRQRYDLFYEELKRFIEICTDPDRATFISPIAPALHIR